MSEEIIFTKSAEETQGMAEDLAKKLKGGDFLAFFGDLGSGKTTFIQGLARALGINRRIISPTFIIIRTYDLESKVQDLRSKIKDQRVKTFYHIDLYRTETKDDLLGLGIDQIIDDKSSIVALEWAEKMGDLLPKKRIEVHFECLKDDERKITINRYE